MNKSGKYILFLCLLTALVWQSMAQSRPRVIVSTDIGGTDEDDFQSMIHYLMYADRFRTEGLIASPYGEGRKKDILYVLDLYEQDYPKLKARSNDFPAPDMLRVVTKQGTTERAPLKGWSEPSEGSKWIVECAMRGSEAPLWVLVWGGLEDVAQALHDAPEIVDKLRVYWIGGPNKKWSADAYRYIAGNFPDLWMIEANATYRGWFVDDKSDLSTNINRFYDAHIKGRGAMGRDFINYYEGVIKMGDTPSVAYLLDGDPDRPDLPGWGGSFVPLKYSSRRIFERVTSLADSVPVFSLVEWVFQGPGPDKETEEPPLWVEIDGQRFEGHYEGEGLYRVRFVPKSIGRWEYKVTSQIPGLDGLEGQFTSVDPWPGKTHEQDITPLDRWWSDDPNPALFEEGHQGAKTVFQWQKDFLEDWARRWEWLEEK